MTFKPHLALSLLGFVDIEKGHAFRACLARWRGRGGATLLGGGRGGVFAVPFRHGRDVWVESLFFCPAVAPLRHQGVVTGWLHFYSIVNHACVENQSQSILMHMKPKACCEEVGRDHMAQAPFKACAIAPFIVNCHKLRWAHSP